MMTLRCLIVPKFEDFTIIIWKFFVLSVTSISMDRWVLTVIFRIGAIVCLVTLQEINPYFSFMAQSIAYEPETLKKDCFGTGLELRGFNRKTGASSKKFFYPILNKIHYL
jgi:hypothetical protein